jgi:hypothetical protein
MGVTKMRKAEIIFMILAALISMGNSSHASSGYPYFDQSYLNTSCSTEMPAFYGDASINVDLQHQKKWNDFIDKKLNILEFGDSEHEDESHVPITALAFRAARGLCDTLKASGIYAFKFVVSDGDGGLIMDNHFEETGLFRACVFDSGDIKLFLFDGDECKFEKEILADFSQDTSSILDWPEDSDLISAQELAPINNA